MAINNDNSHLEETSQDLVIVEDAFLQAGFTQLPNFILKLPDLSHSAKLTYAMLLSYAWQKDSCFAGQEALANDLQVTARAVRNYLDELKKKQLIRVERRGLGKTNIYYIRTSFEADRNGRSSLDRKKTSSLDRNNSSDKEYSLKNIQKEEYEVSRVSKRAALEKSRESRGDPNTYQLNRLPPTKNRYRGGDHENGGVVHKTYPQETDLQYRDISSSKASKHAEDTARPPASLTPIAALLTTKHALIANHKNNRFSKAPPPPEIESAIRDVSGKLSDTKHIRENISQAAHLFRAWGGVNGSSFASFVYEACSITRQQDAVKKQMPYFFRVLKGLLGLVETEQGSIAPG